MPPKVAPLVEKTETDYRKELERDASFVVEQLTTLEQFSDPAAQDPEIDEITMRQRIFAHCFIACCGRWNTAARIAKIDPKTAWRWLRVPEFQDYVNDLKFEWEMRLHANMMQLADNGNVIANIFLLKFLNPFYDDAFRTRALAEVVSENIYERYPIPRPEFLPPEIPERFEPAGANESDGTGQDAENLPAALVHVRGDS